jgi:hypothetical protein
MKTPIEPVIPAALYRQAQDRIRELERQLRVTVEQAEQWKASVRPRYICDLQAACEAAAVLLRPPYRRFGLPWPAYKKERDDFSHLRTALEAAGVEIGEEYT